MQGSTRTTASPPLYEVIEEAGLAVFHTGQSGVGAAPGGGGVRLKYSNPMHVDDVAVDFPEITIVLAHPSFPWQDEALAVAVHKPQVYIDLSGWSPKYFPPQLVQLRQHAAPRAVLFGTDYPLITPERWMADFEQLEIKPEVKPLILKQNAMRLLGLGRVTAGVSHSAAAGRPAARRRAPRGTPRRLSSRRPAARRGRAYPRAGARAAARR